MFSSSPDKLFENTLRCFSNSFTVSLFQVATQNSSWQVLIEGDHKAQECGVLFNETSAKAGFKIKDQCLYRGLQSFSVLDQSLFKISSFHSVLEASRRNGMWLFCYEIYERRCVRCQTLETKCDVSCLVGRYVLMNIVIIFQC
ncbi:unnamed protein product [Cuscuta epithymum]|uniref:Uncharacterized protein n=1 Tax=Cuscuta epithymum TaxID=186058 RepID=A0AAV0CUZ9_9ASTE|nr:unnamed protein product [Cuscuta epithymum]